MWDTDAGRIAAQIQSKAMGAALITFHLCKVKNGDNEIQYNILKEVVLKQAPPANEFWVINNDNGQSGGSAF